MSRISEKGDDPSAVTEFEYSLLLMQVVTSFVYVSQLYDRL
jgi:hypothetical protein